ncbi:MAG: 50S ribosomal protein L21 [Gammaproteobacteria bacterium]|nr:50S ribosomal protein L21 [Gammaproteobacteria bacterium]
MYAVIKTGGKQYKVSEGETLKVEKLNAEEGASIDLSDVLMVADGEDVKVGRPFLEGGKVTATVASHGRAKKISIVKFKRRKHHRKQMGHRQSYTEIKIDKITA